MLAAASFPTALLEGAPAVVGRQALHRFDERGQRGFGVRGNREVNLGVPLEILVVALDAQVARRDADRLRAGFRDRFRRALQLVAERVEDAEEVRDFETHHDVGVSDHGGAAKRLVERVARGEIHAAVQAHDRGLQQLGQLDQECHAGGRACQAVGHQHGTRGIDEKTRRFRNGARIALRRGRQGELRDPGRGAGGNRPLLQLAVGDDHHRTTRRRHRDLVRTDRRLAEMWQRHRRVVPLRVVAHDRRRVLHAVHPLDAGLAHGGVERVAEDQIHGDPVAVGVVNRHRGVLHADGAMCEHRERLAFDLVVAVRHGDRRLFMAARDQLGLAVAAVVDDRFVQSAEARAGVRADIVNAERFDHVDHIVGTAAALREDLGLGRASGLVGGGPLCRCLRRGHFAG